MMDRKEIEEKVKEILARKLSFPKDKIKLEMSLTDDLGMDSFGAVEIVFELEKTFDIEIPEEDASSIKTAREAIDYIYKKICESK